MVAVADKKFMENAELDNDRILNEHMQDALWVEIQKGSGCWNSDLTRNKKLLSELGRKAFETIKEKYSAASVMEMWEKV